MNESYEKLIAGVAHEISNPINFAHVGAQAVRKDLERFREFIARLLTENADETVLLNMSRRLNQISLHVDAIIEGTSRSKDMIEMFRSLSQFEDSNRKVILLHEFVLSTVRLVQPRFLESSDIVVQISNDLYIECWPNQLNQVFTNIIVNAWHAIQSKAATASSCQRGIILIQARKSRGLIWVDFSDNGCGMSEETLSNLYTPYFTTKDVGMGTGLGLAISAEIVAKHQGKIRVSTKINHGSTISLGLPPYGSTAELS